MDNAIFIKNGVYAVDQEIIDRSDINSVGFYIYTKKSSFEKFQYKGGQTINGISRIKTQASDDESILIWLRLQNTIKRFIMHFINKESVNGCIVLILLMLRELNGVVFLREIQNNCGLSILETIKSVKILS